MIDHAFGIAYELRPYISVNSELGLEDTMNLPIISYHCYGKDLGTWNSGRRCSENQPKGFTEDTTKGRPPAMRMQYHMHRTPHIPSPVQSHGPEAHSCLPQKVNRNLGWSSPRFSTSSFGRLSLASLSPLSLFLFSSLRPTAKMVQAIPHTHISASETP